MKLLKIYQGKIKSFHNTPCKVAIFTDDREIKVLQKEFFKNAYGITNWERNIVLEKHSIKVIEEKLIATGFTVC